MNREFVQKIMMGVLATVLLCCVGVIALTLSGSTTGVVDESVVATLDANQSR